MSTILGRLTSRPVWQASHPSPRSLQSSTNYASHLLNLYRLSVDPRRHHSTRLAEVGRFEAKYPNEECYKSGQTFLHRIFGYRGVALFPWLARVHDIDVVKQNSSARTETESHNESDTNDSIENESQRLEVASNESNGQRDAERSDNDEDPFLHQNRYKSDEVEKEGQFHGKKTNYTNPSMTRFHPYYQVLMDKRDCAFVSNRTQTEAVTFLGHPDNSKSVYSIKALDYVAHEDILPYTSHEEPFIQHDLYKKLFQYDASNPLTEKKQYVPTALLQSWRSKHPWLELSHVYRETTHDVRVTVIPFYLGHTSIEGTSFHWWRYCVRLENFGTVAVQLRERSWKIFSQTNMLQTIKGRGVVGVEPLLTQSEPAYQYSSHVNLQDKSGRMWGTFKMQREDGHTFDCRIPAFSLESSLDSY